MDSSCDETPGKLSKWKRQLYSRITNGEVPFAPPAQMLACEVNFQSSFSETPPLDTDCARCEHINLTQTASAPVDFWLDSGSRSDDWESCIVEQRVRSSSDRLQSQVVAVSGKNIRSARNISINTAWR